MNRYISDLHFGHKNVIRFDGRPFSNTEEMEDKLVENWNRVVRRNDTTYILGDFCWGKEPEWIRVLSRLSGNKVLIRGNHDLKTMSSGLRNLFQDVKDYKEIDDNGRKVILCHYPMLFYRGGYRPDCFMLCGHVHVTRENDYLAQWRAAMRASRAQPSDSFCNVINVGCMLPYVDYTPRTLDELVTSLEGLA